MPDQQHYQRKMVFRMVILCGIIAYGSVFMQRMDDKRKAREAELLELLGPKVQPKRTVPETLRRGARTPILRPEVQPDRAVADAVVDEAPATGDGLTDKRTNPGSDDPEDVKARLTERFEDVGDDVKLCLESWWMLDPALSGEVMIGFTLDSEGLQEAWIEDHDGVPFGPLTCFSAAVWEVDWTGVTTDELQVTFPFVFHPEDPDSG